MPKFGVRRFPAAFVFFRRIKKQKRWNSTAVQKGRFNCGVRGYVSALVDCGAFPPLLLFVLCVNIAIHAKGNAVEDWRVRLIERLCRLPEEKLSGVEELLRQLEGDSVRSQLP